MGSDHYFARERRTALKTRIAALLIAVLILIASLMPASIQAKQPPKGLAVITGTVTITHADGKVVPAVGWNLWVTVPGPNGYQAAHTTTDGNGNYAMAVLAGEGYTVSQEWRPGYEPDPLSYEGVRAYRTVRLNFNNVASPQ